MAKTILIVDDDPTQRRMLESIIGAQGYRVQLAQDGLSALGTLRGPRGSEIDLVLLDLSMPGMNGLQVLAEFANPRKTTRDHTNN